MVLGRTTVCGGHGDAAIPRGGRYKASLNGNFIKGFMALNIITFADMARREKDRVL